MQKLVIPGPLILLSSLAVAQDITISGRVTDAETKEPLPFASVWIKSKTIGTITNAQGDFDFHIPAEFRNETLVISMLGYNDFESGVNSLNTDEPLAM
jgi:hypothetical protein